MQVTSDQPNGLQKMGGNGPPRGHRSCGGLFLRGRMVHCQDRQAARRQRRAASTGRTRCGKPSPVTWEPFRLPVSLRRHRSHDQDGRRPGPACPSAKGPACDAGRALPLFCGMPGGLSTVRETGCRREMRRGSAALQTAGVEMGAGGRRAAGPDSQPGQAVSDLRNAAQPSGSET